MHRKIKNGISDVFILSNVKFIPTHDVEGNNTMLLMVKVSQKYDEAVIHGCVTIRSFLGNVNDNKRTYLLGGNCI